MESNLLNKPLISSYSNICVGARSSALSKAQVWEVFEEIKKFYPMVLFSPHWVVTTGDKDLLTPLKTLDKTDFFTKEIDEMLLNGTIDIAVHSAKDLPDPLRKGLVVAAITKGLDSSDSLVLRENETIDSLPRGALIGTSSARREEAIKKLRSDFICVDIRGNIEQRLEMLDQKKVDGIILAECALIRLKLHWRNRISLSGETAALQGQLAVVVREDNPILREIFNSIDENALFRNRS
ncbi:MAG TPA: hydroxymethylbilane synthase [Rhabdochlamydiaceae bacterium]|nr:hydroxymethylbilane synthase [Rhabdochlamydiaceae bacterium]